MEQEMKRKTVMMSRKDYKGCNEDIKQALVDGYSIECKVSNFEDADTCLIRSVVHYEDGQYRTLLNGSGSWFNFAEPNFK